jgi:tetratricopeptide (TPR) repeat protein
MVEGSEGGKGSATRSNGHGWTPPNAVQDEQDTRTQLATKLREKSLAVESGYPPDIAGSIETFIEGLRVHAVGTKDLFPEDRRLLLFHRCLESSHTKMGSPGTADDYVWLGRAAALAARTGTDLPLDGIPESISHCLTQARSLIKEDPPKNEELSAALPWLVSASRMNDYLRAVSGQQRSALSEDERRSYARLYYRLGGTHFEAGHWAMAARIYLGAEELDPTHASVRFNRALSLSIENRYPEAKVEVYDLVALEGWLPDSLYTMGVIAEHQKLIPEALAFYALSIATGNGYSQSWGRLQQLVQKGGEKPLPKGRAETEGSQSSESGDSKIRCSDCNREIAAKSLICPFCGSLCDRGGQSSSATPSSSPPPGALELPTMEAVAEKYGGSYGANTDGHRPADFDVARLEEVVRKLGGPDDVGKSPRRRMDLAVALMELDRPEEARGILEGLVREYPTSPSLTTGLLRTLYKLKEWDEVLKVSATLPESKEVLGFKICALIAKGQREEARALIGRLPVDTPAQCEEVARYCLAVGDHPTALTLTDKALTQDPSNRRIASLKELISGQSISTGPRSSLAKFVGIDPVIRLLVQRVIAPLVAPESYLNYDITNFQVLLAGPPGCGKTTIAHALADEASASFEHFRFEQVGDLYLGETEKAIHQFFVKVRRQAQVRRVVLFIDEVDGLAVSRGVGDGREERRIFTQVLTEISELSEHLRKETLNLRVISATNRPFDLDPSMLRTGRLGTPIYLGPPTLKARRETLQQRLSLLPHDEHLDLDTAAIETEWYSVADLFGLITDITFEERSANLVGKPWKLTSDQLLREIRGRAPSVVGWFRQVDALIQTGRVEPSDLGKGFSEDYERFCKWAAKEKHLSHHHPGTPDNRMFG